MRFMIEAVRVLRGHCVVVLPLILSVLCLTGCGGPKVVHVEQDESFTYSTATGEGLGVIGVTSAVGSDDERAAIRRDMPSLLARDMYRKRDDLKIVDPAVLRDALGSDAHALLLDSYQTSGDLNAMGVATLTAGVGDLIRYAILARIYDNRVNQRTDDESNAVTDPHIDYITSRYVAVQFTIYDLKTGITAWTGRIENSEDNKRTEQIEEIKTTSDQSFTEGCASSIMQSCITGLFESIFGGGGDPYPEAPSLSDVADDIFSEFADNLPKEEE